MKVEQKFLVTTFSFEELSNLETLQIEFDKKLYYYTKGFNAPIFLESPKCRYCGLEIKYFELWIDFRTILSKYRFDLVPRSSGNQKFNIDHYIPLSKNGPDLKSNMVTSCYSCNKRKGAKNPEKFLKEFNR